VTSHPDLACDVCSRRLLRGEQPDYFIADGRRLLVCELCAPRATYEGWLRETDAAADVALPPQRPRRGRSLLDRLVQAARPEPSSRADREHARRAFAEPFGMASADEDAPAAPADLLAEPEPAAPTYLDLAVAAFNASDFPRRVAGVARSLGEPVVNVRSAEHLESVVRIVVAWELCWYRYEIDLADELPTVRVSAQGSELEELDGSERDPNASADADGVLTLRD
jgi:hypothetical protein